MASQRPCLDCPFGDKAVDETRLARLFLALTELAVGPVTVRRVYTKDVTVGFQVTVAASAVAEPMTYLRPSLLVALERAVMDLRAVA